MPVWQQLANKYQDNDEISIINVAIDLQGPDRVYEYAKTSKTTFPTAVDENNIIGQKYGFKSIPSGLIIDREGILIYRRTGGFDIRHKEVYQEINNILVKSSSHHHLEKFIDIGSVEIPNSSIQIFREGVSLYKIGKFKEALDKWNLALKIDPDNYIIRKQVWAIKNPSRFYSGKVDYDWQNNQTRN